MCSEPEVRDVEALDPHRQDVHAERLLESVERLDPGCTGPLGAQAALLEGEPGVAFGELEDPPLVATLGVADRDASAADLTERLGECGRALDTRRDDHLRGTAGADP